MLARARGVEPGTGSECLCCGRSPFDRAAPAKRVLGATFSDHACLLAPDVNGVCAGCVSLLMGRPGDDPPPLRTSHCLAVEGEPATYPATADLATILRNPPSGRFVLVWAQSRKRHASLRAEISTPDRMRVGGDEATVEYVPARHVAVLDAVESLRSTFRSDDILSGGYPSHAIQRFGAQRWAALESTVAPFRGDPVLAMICHVAPKGERPEEEDKVIDPHDQRAARLLALIAQSSSMRAERGKEFWGGAFAHRLERVRRLPLPTAMSRLMASIDTAPATESTQQAMSMLREMTEEDTSGVENALRERPSLCVALAYDDIKARREARGATR